MTGAGPITVHGHCATGPDRIAALVAAGRADRLTAEPGDFVIVVERAGEVTLVSSRSGAVRYHYDTRRRRTHGRCLADVLAAAGRPLSWNHTAVADYLAVGHLLGDETLDLDVRRVPAGSVVTLDGTGARVVTPPVGPPPPASAGTALAALREAVRQAAGDGCTLSMSGGLDARLLLAALLADGQRPHLLISGVPGSFDRRVATTIARDLGLPHTVHAVPATALVTGADRVAWATDGLLPISNWAGMAHLAQGRPPRPVLLGYHGEVARGYYLPPVGRAALAAARRPARAAVDHLLRRFGDPFRPAEHDRLAPGLSRALRPAALGERLRAVLPQTGSLLDATGNFFHTQYGQHKVASNLAAIGTFAPWRVPLLAPAWTDAVHALDPGWKLGDRWHRYAISRLCPRLLDYPEEGFGARTAARPPVRYWLRGPRPPASPFYVDQRPLRGAGPVRDALARTGGHGLDDLVAGDLVPELVTEQFDRSTRPHLCFALAALARWRTRNALPTPVPAHVDP